MTVKYALSKFEISRFFVHSLARSPRLLLITLGFSLWPGLGWLWVSGAISRGITAKDGTVALGLTLGACCFLALWISLRGKTAQRTLTVTEEGIHTEIGQFKSKVPWEKVKSIDDAGSFVFIVRSNGNAFFVPNRAFSGAADRQRFLSEIRRWQNGM